MSLHAHTKHLAQLALASTLILGSAPLWSAPADYDTLVQQAMDERNRGQFDNAEQLLRQAYELAADKTEASYLLAMVLAFQQRYDEAQTLLEQALARTPDDLTLQLGQARVLAFRGQLTEAASATARIRERDPASVEAINLAGRIALYQRQPRRGLESFEMATSLQPDDLEAWIGKHDALLALGQQDAAQDALEMAAALAPGHADVISRQQPDVAAQALSQGWNAGTEYSRFRGVDFERWQEHFVEYERQHSLDTGWFARVDELNRFERSDMLFSAGINLARRSAMPWRLTAAVSPNGNFSADWRVGAAFTRRLSEGNERLGPTLVSPTLQLSRYSTGDVWRVGFDFEHYLTGADAWLTPSIGLVRDENGSNSLSLALGAHWQISEDVRIGATVGDGAETENKITTDTRSRSVYLRWQFSDRLAVNAFAARYDRQKSYTRDTLGISLMLRY